MYSSTIGGELYRIYLMLTREAFLLAWSTNFARALVDHASQFFFCSQLICMVFPFIFYIVIVDIILYNWWGVVQD